MKKHIQLAFCKAVCPEEYDHCKIGIVHDFHEPDDCPFKAEDLLAAIERGDLRLKRSALRRAKRELRHAKRKASAI